MDEYRFAIDVNYLATGKKYRKGQIVPLDLPNREAIINSKAVYRVSKEVIPDKVYDYSDMSYQELGDLMDERGLEFERSTEARIKALLESDK